MRVAYFAHPDPYGLYSVYRSLRVGLAGQGVELRWVGVGPRSAAAAADPRNADERASGEVVAGDVTVEAALGAALVRHIESSGYDAVVINPPQSAVQMNVARYLSPGVVRIAIVHSTAPGSFRVTAGIRDHLHATVGVSPRGRDDMVNRFGFPADRTRMIPNGLRLEPYRSLVRGPAQTPLRLLYLGRIDRGPKGVLWVPEIMARLTAAEVQLDMYGEGPDMAELRSACAAMQDRVRIHGLAPASDVPALCAAHDVLVLPSRSEGLPMTLIEAMAAGCVPVASHIHGVTDYVVREGETGLLFPIGDTAAAAEAIRRLHRDRPLWARLSEEARRDVHERFSVETVGASYASLLRELRANPPAIQPPLDPRDWSYPREFSQGLKRFIPERVKESLRVWLTRR